LGWAIKKLQVGEVEEGTLIFRRTVDEKFLVAGVTDVSCAGKSTMFGLLVVLLPVNVYSTSIKRDCGAEHLAKNRLTVSLPVTEVQLTPDFNRILASLMLTVNPFLV
jgi:hypothetical protein